MASEVHVIYPQSLPTVTIQADGKFILFPIFLELRNPPPLGPPYQVHVWAIASKVSLLNDNLSSRDGSTSKNMSVEFPFLALKTGAYQNY